MSEWLLPLQVLINDALQYDELSLQKVQKLAGKTIVLTITEPTLVISLCIESDGFVYLQSGKVTPFAASVSGKAKDIFAILRAQDRTEAMMQHEINIEGDTRAFFAIQDVMSHLEIDWEMALADKIGDLAAHAVADGLRLFGAIAKNHVESFTQTSRNFVKEESGFAVPKSLWQAHEQGIGKVKQEVDRFAAKTKQLDLMLRSKIEEQQQ